MININYNFIINYVDSIVYPMIKLIIPTNYNDEIDDDINDVCYSPELITVFIMNFTLFFSSFNTFLYYASSSDF